MASSKKVIVIGAGLGGLSAAIHLAAKGFDVTIIEKNATVGGKMQELRSPNGYRFDLGPTLITMPFVFESLFAAAGRKLSDYLELIPLEASCRYFFQDGTVFTAYCNRFQFEEEVARVFPSAAPALKPYFDYAKRIYDATAESFIYNPLSFSRLFKTNPIDLFKIDALSTVHKSNVRFFSDPRFVQFLDRFPTYVGSSPYFAPATLNVIAFVELAFGGFYIKGGMQRLAEAYLKLALELGVTLETNAEVTAILDRNKVVTGVQVKKNGAIETLEALAVVSNDDAIHTYTALTDKAPKRLKNLEASCSGYVLTLGVKDTYPNLSHHNIFFTKDYKHEFEEIFTQGVMPSDPTIYLTRSCHSDAGQSPEGSENWFLLINAPFLSERYNWKQDGKLYKNLVNESLEKRGFIGLSGKIEFEAEVTPEMLYQKFYSHRGSIYGLSSNGMMSAFLRPRNRSPYLKGLYIATGSAHPGGGTPMVTLSGKFAAELLIQDFQEL
ncbi:MAG: phytoene desaturase family protein [Chloroherpetonaceae bacterium]|nr:phytoene desaturase family protein [Chloroherpetonaceae bacterium]